VIDVEDLRSKITEAMHQPPWCLHDDRMGKGIGARTTKYDIGDMEFDDDSRLAVAAVNALPELLAVYEAACALRDFCRDPNRPGFDMRDGARLHARLFDAVDVTRSGP
jgi:hypothetical protein